MTKPIKRKQTKKQNRKPKTQNRKTRKQNRKTTKKQKGGNNDDELNMIVHDESLDALKEYIEQGGDVNKKGSKGSNKSKKHLLPFLHFTTWSAWKTPISKPT